MKIGNIPHAKDTPMTTEPDPLEHNPQMFVSVHSPSAVFVGMKYRLDFDTIDLPQQEFKDENGHVLTKTIESGGVKVTFQYWEKSLSMDGLIRARDARRKAAAAALRSTGSAALRSTRT